MVAAEPVLELGFEGGSATIHRTPLPSGGYRFHVEGTSVFAGMDDDEERHRKTTEPFTTIHQALSSISEDGRWILLFPLAVHPDYRPAVWQQVRDLASRLSGEHRRLWEHRREHWEQLCLAGRGSPDLHGHTPPPP